MTFREWLDETYYPGFDPSGLSDEEYMDLEDRYSSDTEDERCFVCYITK